MLKRSTLFWKKYILSLEKLNSSGYMLLFVIIGSQGFIKLWIYKLCFAVLEICKVLERE